MSCDNCSPSCPGLGKNSEHCACFYASRMLAFCLLLTLVLNFASGQDGSCATLTAVKGPSPSILVEGAIGVGDSEKIKKMLDRMHPAPGQSGEVIFDSPGGNFMEGIYMGMEIFDHGWATRVKSEGICLSACAIAFLGGRFKIDSSGWLPDRNLEAGATLGFHSFFVDSDFEGSVAQSLDVGKSIANIFYAYANMLGIRPSVLVKMLSIDPDKIMMANYPEILEDLSITVSGLGKEAATTLTPRGAINASLALVDKQQPLLLNEEENNWRLKPYAAPMETSQFKREMARRLIRPVEKGREGQLAKIIAEALRVDFKLDPLYEELAQLDLAPRVLPSDHIFKVTGLNHRNPYMNRVVYFIARKEGSPDFAVDYLLCPSDGTGGKCEEGTLKRFGDIFYELLPRDKPLWGSQ